MHTWTKMCPNARSENRYKGSLYLSLALLCTYKHTLIIQDVTAGIKPLTGSETFSRLSFRGSHTQSHKYTWTHFCNTCSNTYRLAQQRHTKLIFLQIYPSIYSSCLCLMTHPPVSLYQWLFWLEEVLLATGFTPLMHLSKLPLCVQ